VCFPQQIEIQIIPKKLCVSHEREQYEVWGVRVILPKSASHESSNSAPDFSLGGEIPV